MTMGFGDTHPGKLNPAIFARMVANAQKHGKKYQEKTIYCYVEVI